MTVVHGWCANSRIARVRLASDNQKFRGEIVLAREIAAIKDARMARIEPARRPHYTPEERLRILAVKAATGWNNSKLARRFQLAPLTIAGWQRRLDEDGPDALVKMPEPVNRFPDFVRLLVQQLKACCPIMGKKRIAQMLPCAGLHLAPSIVGRFLREKPKTGPPAPAPAPTTARAPAGKTVIARRANHVWGLDLTTVPTLLGFWVPWFPNAIVPVWPFAWWLAVVVDHFSRRVLAIGVFAKEPTAAQIGKLLERARRKVGAAPKYTVTDHGVQFQEDFRQWCHRHGVQPRYGAVGKYGSIAIVERFWRSLKAEAFGFRIRSVPLATNVMQKLCEIYVAWFNESRAHQGLHGATPREIFDASEPLHAAPHFEPRARYPAAALCAAPPAAVRGHRGVRLELAVSHPKGAPYLPIVEIRKAA
jgi:putative transposase